MNASLRKHLAGLYPDLGDSAWLNEITRQVAAKHKPGNILRSFAITHIIDHYDVTDLMLALTTLI